MVAICVEYDREPEADVRLSEELFEGLPVPAPDLDREEMEWPDWCVVARRDGDLLGWAEVYDPKDGKGVVDAQWLVVSRERERIVSGRNVARAASAEELDVAARLLRGAVDSAREAGYRAVEWTGTENEIDERAAAELGAAQAEELGRHWMTQVPLADWRPPAGLPAVTVRRVPEAPDEALLSGYARFFSEITGQAYDPQEAAEVLTDLPPVPHLALDLLSPEGELTAQVTAVAADEAAVVDAVFHRDTADAGQLAALIAELIADLRKEHPDVRLLEVQEGDDAVLADALTELGLSVTGHWRRYRIGL